MSKVHFPCSLIISLAGGGRETEIMTGKYDQREKSGLRKGKIHKNKLTVVPSLDGTVLV